jgi:hypothetical protein
MLDELRDAITDEPLRNIVDGFTHNMNLRPLCNQYPILALQEMEMIRRAKNLRPRWYAVPENTGIVIPARGVYEYQVSVAPGSLFYGIVWDNSNHLYSVQITDACTDIALFSEHCPSDSYDTTNFRGVCLLPRPTIILEPGVLVVEIGSTDPAASSAVTLQIVLLFAETIIACPEQEQQ